ncbi:hypothetical protein QTN47_06800 [Danxiaibacter flavus]|uniref:Uncharacterized protein n=1 Tax=Danxiaibacter flavus TaxID=3049108 RepID=A0ABV3ZCJ6_9BACT|nr:hypothetical protein QNM32_06800 [Chitinophagaceae bacterium DXS]
MVSYKWFSFLNKLALIGNFFFILCVIAHFSSHQFPQFITGFALIVGLILSPIVNIVVNFSLVYFILKNIKGLVPAWQSMVNMGFLLLQLLYFFIF